VSGPSVIVVDWVAVVRPVAEAVSVKVPATVPRMKMVCVGAAEVRTTVGLAAFEQVGVLKRLTPEPTCITAGVTEMELVTGTI